MTGGIKDLLLHGEGHAITARELSTMTGRAEREITRSIQAARLGGVPICASGAGFFLAEDTVELKGYINALDRRLREIMRTREALAAALDGKIGQGRIEGWTDG